MTEGNRFVTPHHAGFPGAPEGRVRFVERSKDRRGLHFRPAPFVTGPP
jgi:hypothetical protein